MIKTSSNSNAPQKMYMVGLFLLTRSFVCLAVTKPETLCLECRRLNGGWLPSSGSRVPWSCSSRALGRITSSTTCRRLPDRRVVSTSPVVRMLSVSRLVLNMNVKMCFFLCNMCHIVQIDCWVVVIIQVSNIWLLSLIVFLKNYEF